MTHVDVDTPGIGQKPAVAGWLIMSTMVKIKDPATSDMKDVIPDTLRDPGRRMVRPILVDQEAVFGFEPEDTIQHVSQLSIPVSGFVLAAAATVVLQCVGNILVRIWGPNGRGQQLA